MSKPNTEQVLQLAKQYFPTVQTLRRDIHQHPELSFEEQRTSKIVQEKLSELGIPFETMAKTGVVGLIQGGQPGKTVLLRADMDALPVQEAADVPYRSQHDGKMHACGHDGHTASLLGTAMILNDLKAQIHGNIKLMFQPAEEKIGGAKPMIEAGILDNPKVDAAFGLHVWGPVAEGKMTVRANEMMASPDTFHFTVKGRGGHAAMPHLCVDPINITVQAISAMQNILTRHIDPTEHAVVSFCSIHAGDAANVIPQEVKVSGTIRTFSKALRESIPARMKSMLEHICEANGARCEFELLPDYPALINDPDMTQLTKTAVAKVIGLDNVIDMPRPNMGGEDFAFLCEKVPACYYFFVLTQMMRPNQYIIIPIFAGMIKCLNKPRRVLPKLLSIFYIAKIKFCLKFVPVF